MLFSATQARKAIVIVGALALLLGAQGSSATVVINLSLVGDAGNAADGTGHGAVNAPYRISRYEVTNTEYTEFLNAKDPTGANTLGLYNTGMMTDLNAGGIDYASGAANGTKYTIKAGQGNKPVTMTSWYDSLRFANWLHNGQGAGSTETGAYTLQGNTPTPSNAATILRNAGASVFIPTEDEWYKAAFYKSGGTNAGYWTYATRSNSLPASVAPPGTPNSANYYDFSTGYAVTHSSSYSLTQNYLTDVGAYTDASSPYGTFDQNGNVYEWNETLIGGTSRGTRGASWGGGTYGLPSSYGDFYIDPTSELDYVGFRVAASNVPEPTGMAVLLIGGIVLLKRRAAPRGHGEGVGAAG